MYKFLVLLFLSIFFSACATMNKSECLTADWRSVGYEDGTKGRTTSKLTNRREACAKHGVTIELDEYRSGRDEGLQEFCTEYSGFQQGSRGYVYEGICRNFDEDRFLDGYRDGKHLYSLEQERDRITNRIEHNRYEIKRLDKKVHKLRDSIASETSTSLERTDALDEIISIEHDIAELLSVIDEDIGLQALAERDYQDFKLDLQY